MTNSKRKGLWIAVFGPDGVGKSAVIEGLEKQLAPAFQGISRFHFRPQFRRSCQVRPPITEPHGKPARGVIISLLKLIYWLADCWWGFLSTIVPRKLAGQLVIYDRYLPDILVDPVRYRLPVANNRFAAWLVTFAPRPDLCVLLDAPADVVHQRKGELPLLESRRQRIAYMKLFEGLPCKLLVNADATVTEVSRLVAVGICSLETEPLSQSDACSFVPNL
jgi:thymidylate kinase